MPEEVIDAGHCKKALVALNRLMRVEQEGDPVLPEDCQDLTQLPIPVFMIPHDGEGAVARLYPGHFFHAAWKKLHGVGDVVPGEEEQIGPQRDDLIDDAPHLSPGHENAGMDVAEL